MLTLAANSPAEQEALGARLARALDSGCIIYLEGELGAGKTTLVRGFLRGMDYRGPVKSPTYTLLEPYETDGMACYHFDLYRLGDPEELEYLGIRDLLDSESIILIEWPDRGQGFLPASDLTIRIQYRDGGRALEFIPQNPVGDAVVERLGSGGMGMGGSGA